MRRQLLAIAVSAALFGVAGFVAGRYSLRPVEERIAALEQQAKSSFATKGDIEGIRAQLVSAPPQPQKKGWDGLIQRVQNTTAELKSLESAASDVSTAAPSHNVSTPVTRPSVEVISVESRITESNDSYWKFAWILRLANHSADPKKVTAEIQFKDSDGFVVDDDTEYNLLVPGYGQAEFSGYDLINAKVAPKVSKTVAKVGS